MKDKECKLVLNGTHLPSYSEDFYYISGPGKMVPLKHGVYIMTDLKYSKFYNYI